ncbi:pilus assembly protein [Marinobacter sp. JSM 1782161]|uniref:pilus assembly protein n=1 Tax=Marinobacter sp. JSM 1782161 TaxID=2685906 RepID=UPI001402E2A6|nr:PilC/PilY family type IV pilus protein [Marinobacter sp. JSM 1782161]
MNTAAILHKLRYGVGMALAVLAVSARADITIDDQPVLVTDPLAPNIVFILDDSGSMLEDAMPEDTSCSSAYSDGSKVINPGTGLLNSNVSAGCQSPDYNVLYYNPDSTYTAPVDADGNSLGDADFNAALIDGYYAYEDSGGSASTSTDADDSTVDLSEWTSESECESSGGGWGGGRGGGRGGSSSSCTTTTYPFSYYVWDSSNSGCNGYHSDDDCYDQVFVDTDDEDEMQNVANWYTYYRSRLMTAKAGISIAFQNMEDDYRLGYGRINDDDTISSGVEAFSASKADFYDWLFAQTSGYSYGTPLRRALGAAGEYFTTSEPYFDDPGDTSSEILSCRQNFTILTTDGYWNGDTATNSAATSENDNNGGPTITSDDGDSYTYEAVSPFRFSASDNLADIAMYYWKYDLMTSLANDVPTSDDDPAFWQHMVTLGIGLGVEGNVDSEEAFDAIDTGADIDWTSTSSNAGKIDDLLHAGVNSRGGFYSAQSPTEFAEGLKSALADIQSHTGSGTALSENSSTLTEDTRIYKASYKSGDWSGYLSAWTLDDDGNTDTRAWSATVPDAADRQLFTTIDSGDGLAGAELVWDSLDSDLQAALGDEDTLAYLRGDASNEVVNGGSYRTRSNTVIGDIVHSSPLYVGPPDEDKYEDTGWDEADTHVSFAQTYADRTPVVYIGANDGLVHAFDADSGEELFAYMPRSAALKGVSSLADTDYDHQYFMDGTLVSADVYFDDAWHTVLVGSTGRGGQSLFALDVTDPDNFSADDVLWEVDDSAALGNAIGAPVIAKLQDGDWVIVAGNGYNSTDATAQLLLFAVADGTVTAIDTGEGSDTAPNGLAGPLVWDSDDTADSLSDVAYAGDYLGNVWQFDLTDTSAAPELIFSAVDDSGNAQPITADMTGAYSDDEELWLFFGTGKYLSSEDITSTENGKIQSWYGLMPEDGAIGSRDELTERTIDTETTTDSYTVRSVSEASDGDMDGQRGWYMDLAVNGVAEGERMVLANTVQSGVLIGTTLIPEADSCNPAGDGFVMSVDPYTGASLTESYYDINGDGVIDENDLVNGLVVSGLSTGSTPSTPTFIDDTMKWQDESTSDNSIGVAPSSSGDAGTERISWGEVIEE